MKRKCLSVKPLIAGLVLVWGTHVFASNVKVPEIPGGEVRVFNSYYATESDRPDEDDPLTKNLAAFNPKHYTGEICWKVEGEERRLVFTRKSELNNGARTEMVFTFDIEPEFRMNNYREVLYAPDGTRLSEEYHNFTNPALRYPKGIFHVVVGNMVLRGSELEVGKQISFTVWLSSTMVYPFQYEVIGEETITTPAGTFECYKIEGSLVVESLTDITGIILGMAAGKFYFWVEKGGTHGFVRLRWPTSSGLIPGRTRYQTQDLVELRIDK